MKQIELTQGFVALVDDEDYEELNKHRWCIANKYAIRQVGPRGDVKRLFMHKVILNTDTVVDHIDKDTLNNQKSNLRTADKSRNSMNRGRQVNNTTGFKGVSMSKGRYQSYIKKDGVKINLGTFNTPEEAAHAYDHAAIKLFGEFVHVNFPVNKILYATK